MRVVLNDRAVPDSIRFGAGAPGIERAEVRLGPRGFEPHRHDTYAVGFTTSGVQTFRYRGERRFCLPGQWNVLHPDETHDGASATDEPFGYRIMYLAPELVREAIDRRALPFVENPVQQPTPPMAHLRSYLTNMDDPISDLAAVEIAAAVADALDSVAEGRAPDPPAIDLGAVRLVREHLSAHAAEQTKAEALERLAGIDRFSIARHFRRAFGTSPDRYRTMRRLALARTAIEGGSPIALAAAECGFADQSHLTRQFRRAFGMTPGRWAALTSPDARTR